MKINPTQINRAGAANQQGQSPGQSGSNTKPRSNDDFPTDGPEAQRRRDQMSNKEKAEGDRKG
jgi:hypothetical protein